MTPEVKKRIEQIRQGIVPEGYKKGKIGIVPIKWNDVPFSTLFTSMSEYTDDLKQYPLYSLTIEDGITAKTERYERSHLVKKENSYKVVRPNDYAYNPMNIRFGAVARHKGDIPVAVSGYYDIFTTVHESDLVFMDSFLTYGPMITYYNKVSTGSLVEKQRVHFSDFLEFSLALPPLEERKKIAEILSTQDKTIELQGRKIEELKRFKKGCLEKMFPRKGQKVPEKRFPGFTDNWEQRKAKELFVSTTDKGYPELPVLSATQDRGMIRRDENSINIFHDKKNEAGYKRVLPGQFVIHLRSFQGGFAHSAIEGITSPAYTVFGFSEPEKHDSEYWKYVFTSKSFIQRLETVTYGIRDGRSISYEEFLTLGFVYPSKAEQTAIARYLDKLSDLITLHQRKLEEMKRQKKALMQLLLTGIVRVKA